MCDHDSWCVYAEGIAICMRVESKRPKDFASGERGWLHKVEECSHPSNHTTYKEPKATPVIDCSKLLAGWDRPEHVQQIHNLAHALRVSFGSLTALSCCWAREYRAWAFPMKDAYENVVGIRLRTVNGDKFAVRGSHAGLFIPSVKPDRKTALIVEGPTDAAAALDLGFYAVGKPSATGGAPHIKQFVMTHGIRRIVIVCDNDEVGVKGGTTLADILPIPCVTVVLPAKDLRQFKMLGGTKEMLESKIDQSVWKNA